jgi:hypothetical protein
MQLKESDVFVHKPDGYFPTVFRLSEVVSIVCVAVDEEEEGDDEDVDGDICITETDESGEEGSDDE